MVMKDKKAILFDLDGTIIDPKEGISNSFKYAFSKYGISIEESILTSYIGPPLVDTFKEHALDVHEAIDFFREYFREYGIHEFEVYKDMEEVLKLLNEQGYRLAVATSKPTVYALEILKSAGLDVYFECIEGSFLDNTRTDKGDIIQAVKDQMCLKDLEYVMVGDRKHDIIGAKKKNMDVIGVTYGYGSKEELQLCNPDAIVNSPMAILETFGVIIL